MNIFAKIFLLDLIRDSQPNFGKIFTYRPWPFCTHKTNYCKEWWWTFIQMFWAFLTARFSLFEASYFKLLSLHKIYTRYAWCMFASQPTLTPNDLMRSAPTPFRPAPKAASPHDGIKRYEFISAYKYLVWLVWVGRSMAYQHKW